MRQNAPKIMKYGRYLDTIGENVNNLASSKVQGVSVVDFLVCQRENGKYYELLMLVSGITVRISIFQSILTAYRTQIRESLSNVV